MAKLTRTWWGQRFIQALESFTDPARLGRGRSYASPRRIKSHNIHNGQITAKIEGNINPYFGVYKLPIYTTSVQLTPLSETEWRRIIPRIASQAGIISQLLMNEMPAGIEDVLRDCGGRLLPAGAKDFKTKCSCPDYSNPCKHVAGLSYFLASKLDQDPFLLFELRGLSRQNLRQELLKTPLGKALAQALVTEEPEVEPAASYYTRPQLATLDKVSYQDYWSGDKRLPVVLEPLSPPGIAAVLVKKAGDSPAFWQQKQSFLEIMSEWYARVRKESKLFG